MFRRHIIPVSAAVGLAISLSITTVTLPFVNAAKADQTTGFGLRLNLTSSNDVTPLLNAAQIMRVDWLAQDVKRQESAATSLTPNKVVSQHVLPNWRPRQRPTFGSKP